MLKTAKLNGFNWLLLCAVIFSADQIFAYLNASTDATQKLYNLGLNNGQYFLALLIWLLMALMLLRRTKQPRDWDIVKKALQMALLGLFSNAVSIIIYGRVIDYIQMPWFRTNLADWAIIASLIALAYLIIFPNKKAPTLL